MIKNINVQYANANIELSKIAKGDWIDLRCWGISLIEFEDAVYLDTGGKVCLNRLQTTKPLQWSKGYFNNEEVEYIFYHKGEFLNIDLGIAMELPAGYEAYVVPRGSTFKYYGTIQTNHIGIVDNSYKGNDDIWFLPLLALRDGFIIKGERVCQFRIQKHMEPVTFNTVLRLDNSNRNGHGSTGTL